MVNHRGRRSNPERNGLRKHVLEIKKGPLELRSEKAIGKVPGVGERRGTERKGMGCASSWKGVRIGSSFLRILREKILGEAQGKISSRSNPLHLFFRDGLIFKSYFILSILNTFILFLPIFLYFSLHICAFAVFSFRLLLWVR